MNTDYIIKKERLNENVFSLKEKVQKGRLPLILSICIIILAAIASAGGIFIEDLYRDSEIIKTGWLGNDLVTLFFVIPLFISAVVLAKQGSLRAQLLWMGLLGYMFYNYAFYLFGAVFNPFFLIYVALVSLSVYALIIGLSGLQVRAIKQKFSKNLPVKGISIFLLFISIPLGLVEIVQIINSIIKNVEPVIPPLIYALDLTVVVPNTALAAVLLWKRKSWGFILAALMLVKALTYGLVLSTATVLNAGISLTGELDPFMPFYVFVAVGGFAGTIILFKNLKNN